MSSSDPRAVMARLALAASLALALAGCFRPVYGEVSTAAGPSKSEGVDVERRMKSVEVKAIDGRVPQKMRNELIFLLRGGAGQGQTNYRLTVTKFTEQGQSAIVDPLTGVQESRTISLLITYELAPAGSIEPLFTGNAVATATYFAGLQRFANVRAERDAEDRAATQLAERVRSRLQAYFATGQ